MHEINSYTLNVKYLDHLRKVISFINVTLKVCVINSMLFSLYCLIIEDQKQITTISLMLHISGDFIVRVMMKIGNLKS